MATIPTNSRFAPNTIQTIAGAKTPSTFSQCVAPAARRSLKAEDEHSNSANATSQIENTQQRAGFGVVLRITKLLAMLLQAAFGQYAFRANTNCV